MSRRLAVMAHSDYRGGADALDGGRLPFVKLDALRYDPCGERRQVEHRRVP